MITFGKWQIHFTFFISAALMIALGQIGQFFILFICVTIHELSHVAAAGVYGIKLQKIVVTPLGEIACIGLVERLTECKKIIVMAAGPLSNIIIYFFCRIFLTNVTGADLVGQMNLALGCFNLMPFYPLDGGKILYYYLGNRFGVAPAGRVTAQIAKLGNMALYAVGFLQLVFYPYNISLMCIAAFFMIMIKQERVQMLFSFYMALAYKKERPLHSMKPVFALFSKKDCVYDVLNVFTWDRHHILLILGDAQVAVLTESDIAKYLESGSVTDSLSMVLTQKWDTA